MSYAAKSSDLINDESVCVETFELSKVIKTFYIYNNLVLPSC